jgi:hypothetical protein
MFLAVAVLGSIGTLSFFGLNSFWANSKLFRFKQVGVASIGLILETQTFLGYVQRSRRR